MVQGEGALEERAKSSREHASRWELAGAGPLATEYTAHKTSASFFAAGWWWLDQRAGDGTVAAICSPNSYFVYPVMGPRFERDVRYININAQDLPRAHDYPECEPRVDPSPKAWLENLAKHKVRWVYFSRYPQFQFPLEGEWARARPDVLLPRFEGPTNGSTSSPRPPGRFRRGREREAPT